MANGTYDPALGPPVAKDAATRRPMPSKPNPYNLAALRRGLVAIDENVATLRAGIDQELAKRKDWEGLIADLERYAVDLADWQAEQDAGA